MKKMEASKEEEYTFNMKLTKLVGLYQLLDPNTIKMFGYNVSHIIILFFTLYLFSTLIFCMISVYLSINEIMACVFLIGCAENIIFCCVKMLSIVYYSKDIWKCIDITSFNFMSYGHYDRKLFTNYRTRCNTILYLYTIMAIFAGFIWSVNPIVLNKLTITIRNIDESYSEYRMSILNIFLMVSDETYNSNFTVFYFLEFLCFNGYLYFSLIFELFMILMCFSISCQLHTICNAFESLGYTTIHDNVDVTNITIKTRKNSNIIDNLKMITMDYQSVMRKKKDYYNIFQSVILYQIFVASSSQVLVWFISASSFSDEDAGDSILWIKLFAVLPVFTFQLFMTCYLFGTINENNEKIGFALYSSNWTDMDLKNKKFILNVMKINKANQFKMKFTMTKIINMEIFASTMRICYSTFSMMLKRRNK